MCQSPLLHKPPPLHIGPPSLGPSSSSPWCRWVQAWLGSAGCLRLVSVTASSTWTQNTGWCWPTDTVTSIHTSRPLYYIKTFRLLHWCRPLYWYRNRPLYWYIYLYTDVEIDLYTDIYILIYWCRNRPLYWYWYILIYWYRYRFLYWHWYILKYWYRYILIYWCRNRHLYWYRHILIYWYWYILIYWYSNGHLYWYAILKKMCIPLILLQCCIYIEM